MQRLRALGILLTVGGLGAYGLGAVVAYEGRALSLTALMVGLTLVAIGGESA